MKQLRVTPFEVKRRMDRGERVVFVDTRSPPAWEKATEAIPAAVRVPADQVDRHAGSIPQDAYVVTYCT